MIIYISFIKEYRFCSTPSFIDGLLRLYELKTIYFLKILLTFLNYKNHMSGKQKEVNLKHRRRGTTFYYNYLLIIIFLH